MLAYHVTLHVQHASVLEQLASHVLPQALEHTILEVRHALAMLDIIILERQYVLNVIIHVLLALLVADKINVQLAILMPHYAQLDALKEL